MHLQKIISKELLHPFLAPILPKRVTEDWAVAVFHGHWPHLSGPPPQHECFR